MKVLVFGAPLRARSYNVALAALAAREFEACGAAVRFASLSEFDAPLYNQDVLDTSGFPPGVPAFTRRLRDADAFAVATLHRCCARASTRRVGARVCSVR